MAQTSPPAERNSAICVAENLFDWYRKHIAECISTVTGLNAMHILPAIQRSQKLDKGDCVLAVPALRIKECTPEDTAAAICTQFPDSIYIRKPVAAGSFLPFFFEPVPLAKRTLTEILCLRQDYGRSDEKGLKDPAGSSKGRKKVVVEFGSPNIAKPFHAGHLRSTIIGGFLANVYEFCGWDVVRLNYLGDWGKQYGVLGVGFERFGNDEILETNPIGHLFDVYVQISAISRDEQALIKQKLGQVEQLKGEGQDTKLLEKKIRQLQAECVDEAARQYFKRMCDGESEALGLWQRFRALSIAKYKQTFARLNIRYDEYWGESMVQDESMAKALKQLDDLGLTEKSQGAVIVDLTKHSKSLGKAIIRKRDGTSIYLTRDIGGVFEREEKYEYDKMVYVIAAQQDLHMAQLIKIIALMGRKDLADKLQHVNFGLVQGMSTRRGTVKFLDDILRDATEKMHELMRGNQEKYLQVEDPDLTADILGVSAVLVQDMSGRRINGYTFDMNRMTSFEGDTGPYLQYAHARLCSIVRKAEVREEELLTADFSLLVEPYARDLVRLLAQWPDVVQLTYKTQEPVTVLTYLFRMTHMLSTSYDHLNVIRSEQQLKHARLALYVCAKTVLNTGMKLLCLTPVERM